MANYTEGYPGEDPNPPSINTLSETEEQIIINGIKMPVLPSDITFYSTNAMTQEAYIRAPGAFTFRSKHSRSVLTMTVVIPIMENSISNNYSRRERELAERGASLIASLDAYPFCFIESHRVESYLGSHNFRNIEDDPEAGIRSDKNIMMFGVQKITVTQDLRLTGMVVLEVELLYNNHRVVSTDLDIYWDEAPLEKENKDNAHTSESKKKARDAVERQKITTHKDTEKIMGFRPFIEAVSAVPKARAQILLGRTSAAMAVDNYSTKYIQTQVEIRVPEFINLHELDVQLRPGVSKKDRDFTKEDLIGSLGNIPPLAEENLKFIRLPVRHLPPLFHFNNKSTDPSNPSHHPNSEADPQDVAEDASSALELHVVAWKEDKFAYEQNINPIQSITIVKERSFASHFVGSYQHPFLQYMGRYPATLHITSTFRGSDYTNSTSIPYLFKVMLGVIDNNAVNYPQGSAYNYVKILTYGGALLSSEHFIPKDSQILASSSTSDMEIFSCTFIENSMDKMLEASKIRIGKQIINPASLKVSKDLIQRYITQLKAYLASGNVLEEGEKTFHSQTLRQLVHLTSVLQGKILNLDIYENTEESNEKEE